MPTFGFSAYLKLISLNERPRMTAIRTRVAKVGKGYDYHRAMKLAARRLLVDGEPLDAVLVSAEAIKRSSERAAAKIALERLAQWRSDNPHDLLAYRSATYDHPSGLFSVAFTPDFGVRLGRLGTAVHIWNTAKPELTPRAVYAALALFPDLFDEPGAPDDLALLSLREPQLFRLSEAGRYAGLAKSVAESVAETFRNVRDELEGPPGEDRPPPR